MPIDSGNLALKGLDDLFSTEENRQEEQREQVQQIPIDELYPFTNPPFKVLDDEAMTRTVESIAQYGVLAPLIARPRPEGGYEIISGHRRQYAAKLAGLETLPVIVRQMSDDAAVILMVDSNLQREHMVYHISIYGSDTYKTAQQALQKPIAILREKALGRSGQITLADNKNRPRDVSAEETLRIYEEFLSDVAKSPCFFANILLYANQKSSAHFLMDAVCGEAIKEGTCEIQEIPSTATPLELQEVNQPYCNLLPPSLAFWPTAYTLGEGPANFVTLLLCTLIRETLKASPRADEEKVVRHIIFIEEAHNLIAPEAQVASGQDSNPKIAATAYIVKMLAEVRALREGIIIADQLPTAMAPEVIKNTNIKLIHRLTSIDDRQLIGSTMSASGIQLEHVAVYRPGEALMSYEGLQRPFELRIQEQKGHGSETPNDDELYDIMLHKPAFFQLAQKEENLKLETLKENVKSLKKKEVEALCALSEYDSSVHTSTQITDFYWHMENIYTSIVILRSQYRRDCQAINELFISAERKAMLDELIRSIGESLQQKIKNNVVFLDSNGQLE